MCCVWYNVVWHDISVHRSVRPSIPLSALRLNPNSQPGPMALHSQLAQPHLTPPTPLPGWLSFSSADSHFCTPRGLRTGFPPPGNNAPTHAPTRMPAQCPLLHQAPALVSKPSHPPKQCGPPHAVLLSSGCSSGWGVCSIWVTNCPWGHPMRGQTPLC